MVDGEYRVCYGGEEVGARVGGALDAGGIVASDARVAVDGLHISGAFDEIEGVEGVAGVDIAWDIPKEVAEMVDVGWVDLVGDGVGMARVEVLTQEADLVVAVEEDGVGVGAFTGLARDDAATDVAGLF